MNAVKHRGLILILIAIVGWLAIVRPQLSLFGERALEAKVRSDEALSYAQRIKDIDVIRAQGDSIQPILKAQYLAMPRSSQIPEALVMIESLASSSGVVLSSASIGNPTGNELPVSLSFSGNTGSLTSFLDALNKNIRTVIVKDQSVISDESGNLSVSLSLGLVYQGGEQ